MTHSDQHGPRSVAHAREADRRRLPALDRAVRDLAEVETLVTLVADLRDPSTRRPWRETHLDPYARAELDDEARAEAADRTADAPGEHTDAARADVLDLLGGVLDRAQDLAAYVLRAVRCPVLPPAPADGDPRPYLRRAAENLPRAVVSWPNGAELAYFAADHAAEIAAEVRGALALVDDGHTVKAACPWCRGGLLGGYSWRVRILAGEPLIVCESGVCEPPSRDAGTWWRGAPAWRMGDWGWLAARVAHLDERRAALAPPPPPHRPADGATGRAGTAPTTAVEVEALRGLTPDNALDEWTATRTDQEGTP